ncbi:deoxyguanosinetriphosphate triphosphohydrolase [Aureimonas fodinaquatilis]|uniref:Deoxyguanosinetriphosphate triphosphohydrolase-like protein n=1 Tax=Aureimonas fodinaquatilis TaxID=2565783 RepID=A0A5B0DV54_9HYPH|nr:deoxyguanosinetriphosphate triphosphohydrolase [Aureimonas fodinaquatilis]KAA0970697.1 deoxyguanosinetriphosphate triphosphohydrolase [Aureimonas fodinaquatilis]
MPTQSYGLGREVLAPYATDANLSRGRQVAESDSPTRTPFQRDRDRIVHSTAFRRLKHKTQVFVSHEGDHFRTRLTHTIEVSQIARALARALRLDEDLAEALALAHDFGHTPFGHAGERALASRMAAYGGFDHNAQTLRIVTALERHYAAFDGLNLSYETLEGLVKHNGPLSGPYAGSDPVPPAIAQFDQMFPLELGRFASLEAQAAAISDDIAYNTHDLDDGLRAGLIELDDLEELRLAGSILREVRQLYPGLETARTRHEIMRRHITLMVEDVLSETTRRIAQDGAGTLEAVHANHRTLVEFSADMREAVDETRCFLFQRVYRNESVMRVMRKAEVVVGRLFDVYFERPAEMGVAWSAALVDAPVDRAAVRVADYLAGMTDNYALAEHARLFDESPKLL